ncbi:MAG: 2-oxoglutarate and iron-dependent oxygenase domain-containing protein [Cyanobacteria bacterium J06626_18]
MISDNAASSPGPAAQQAPSNLPIPVVDFAAFQQGNEATKRAIAQQVQQACQNVGFLYLKHHGIAPELVERLFRQAKAFFKLPLAIKNQIPWTTPECNCGYIPMQTQHLDPTGAADLMEAYNIGLRQPGADAKWLPEQTELNQALLEFYQAGGEVCGQVMQAFALAFDLPETHFDAQHDSHYSTVRLLHYPAVAKDIEPGTIRAGAHSDYGTITLLFQDDVGGLEIWHDGSWTPAPYIPGTVVVNTGDLMERWTNNSFRSTKHRVVVLPWPAAVRSRYSMTFFYRPNIDAEVVCLQPCHSPQQPALYPPTTTREHLISCLRNSYQLGNEE